MPSAYVSSYLSSPIVVSLKTAINECYFKFFINLHSHFIFNNRTISFKYYFKSITKFYMHGHQYFYNALQWIGIYFTLFIIHSSILYEFWSFNNISIRTIYNYWLYFIRLFMINYFDIIDRWFSPVLRIIFSFSSSIKLSDKGFNVPLNVILDISTCESYVTLIFLPL